VESDRCDCIHVLFNRDTVDKGDASWTGSTHMSTESLPSKALSMTSGTVLTPVGDSEPLDRSISQPNIAGGLKLPSAVPPSPTVLASCSSTSSDLSRGGYASADSLGSMSSKDDMLSAPLMSDETQSLSTERSTRSASPCHENVPSLSITLDEEPVRSSSLSASLEPTPDLVLNLPTTSSENTTVTCALSPTATSAAEMFASAEHGTIKKSGTPGRSSASGEDGTSMDEVFPHTPVEIMHALDSDSFSFDMLAAPPPALTDLPLVGMKSADEGGELPSDNLPDFPSGCESGSHEGSSVVALPPCTDSLPSGLSADSTVTEEPTAVCESQSKLTTVANAESVTDASEESSTGSFASVKIDNHSSELKSSDLVVDQPPECSVPEVNNVGTMCKLADSESVDKLGLSEDVRSESADAAMFAANLQSHSASTVAAIAEQPVNLCAVSSSDVDDRDVVTSDQSSSAAEAAVLPVDASSCSASAHDAVAAASKTPDVVHLPVVTSSASSSDARTDLTIQSTTPVSPSQLRPVPSAATRPSSSPVYAEPSVTASPQHEVGKTHHPAVERRSSESAVATPSSTVSPAPPQSAVSHLVLATHKQAASVAVTSFPEPLQHRPPPSLAAHSAALGITATGALAAADKPETSAKLEQSPADRPKSKPPPVKKKPAGPLKEKFFTAASGDHHHQ